MKAVRELAKSLIWRRAPSLPGGLTSSLFVFPFVYEPIFTDPHHERLQVVEAVCSQHGYNDAVELPASPKTEPTNTIAASFKAVISTG
jgi:hypothetical protein